MTRCRFRSFLASVLLLLVGCQQTPQTLARGEPIPPFQLPSLGAQKLQVPAMQRGQWLLIHFWADWCPPCLQELRATEPVYRRLAGGRFEVLAVNIKQPRERVARVASDLELSYPVLLDATGEVARRYGVDALPVSFLVDPDGRLYTRLLGGVPGERLEALLHEVL
ncbi:MAG: TlpA family protein disulfide reductase [Sedimenticola sp.]|nr:TlpA family protein disulfide reductase [Sedimenticola sp.]